MSAITKTVIMINFEDAAIKGYKHYDMNRNKILERHKQTINIDNEHYCQTTC